MIRQSLWRFLSPSADHAKPFYYLFHSASSWLPCLGPFCYSFYCGTDGDLPARKSHYPMVLFSGLPLFGSLTGLYRTLSRLRKATPLPRADLSFLCAPGSPWMGPHSREIPKSETLRGLRPDRHILHIRWNLPLIHYSFRKEGESSACIRGSVKSTDQWPSLSGQPFRDHPRCILLLSWEEDTRPQSAGFVIGTV